MNRADCPTCCAHKRTRLYYCVSHGFCFGVESNSTSVLVAFGIVAVAMSAAGLVLSRKR